jgi:phage terminase large subunit-like protein
MLQRLDHGCWLRRWENEELTMFDRWVDAQVALLEWCIGHAAGHYDAGSNVYSRKQWPEQEINAAMAPMMAVSRAMSDDGASAGIDAFLVNPVAV